MNHEKRGKMMYECPIVITIMRDFAENQMIERDNAITLKIQEKIGIDVNKEELIKALNYDRQQYEKGYTDAKAEYEPKWIPVSERLPEDCQFVLMTIQRMDESYNHEPFISIGYISWNQSSWWCAHDGDCKMHNVRVNAWMPLPKPYKENEDANIT